jgi:hypothetical protein
MTFISPNPPDSDQISDTPDIPVMDREKADNQKQEAREARVTYARIIFFVALCFLVITSAINTAIAIILTGILGLLSSSLFEDVFSTVIGFFDGVFEHAVKSPPKLGQWLLRHEKLIINGFISVLIVALMGTIFHTTISEVTSNVSDTVCLRSSVPWPTCNTGVGVTGLPNGVRIGLITNNDFGPFDRTSLNGEEKNVESLIFRENVRACSAPHITLAVVTMLGRTVEDPAGSATNGLADLYGAFLAQQDYNASNPRLGLCLAIASLGTLANADQESGLVRNSPDNYSLPLVIKRLIQFAHHDPTFHGIVGFPYSTQSQEAIAAFQAWPFTSLPVVSPSASGDQLSAIANFYRIVSPDRSQSKIMAQFFCSTLLSNQNSVSIDIFTDTPDAYSQSLQIGFEDNLKQCQNKNIRIEHDAYDNSDAGSIQQAADSAVVKHVDYIFFPGYNTGLDTLETQLRTDQNSSAHITILGGDGLYDTTEVTHYSFSPIYATIFASPLTRDAALNPSSNQEIVQKFISGYIGHKFPLPYLAKSIPPYTLFPPHAILSYDAISAYAETAKHFQTTNFTQNDFNKVLSSVSFYGVSGYVIFQGKGTVPTHASDPNGGYIYIMCTDRARTIHLIAQYESINTDEAIINKIFPRQSEPKNLCS